MEKVLKKAGREKCNVRAKTETKKRVKNTGEAGGNGSGEVNLVKGCDCDDYGYFAQNTI